MSCMQITTCGPHVKATNKSLSHCLPASRLCIAPTSAIKLPSTSPKLESNTLRYQICNPMCLFGDKGNPEKDNEASPWKSLEKAMGSFRKEPSMQDVIREQKRRQELGDYGGGTGSPPGGSSGGGGGVGGSGGSEDEGMAGVWDEVLQVVLATIGFALMYLYILEGEEFTRLAKDYIRYLFTKRTSVRLRRAMYKWKRFYQHLTRRRVKREDSLERSLERAILNTPTWWYDPVEYKRLRASGYNPY